MGRRHSLPDSSKERDEEASRWLDRLSRGLDKEDGAELARWLAERANRAALLDKAPPWQRPDLVALLTQLFPDGAGLAEPPRRGRSAVSMGVTFLGALAIVVFGTLALMGRDPSSLFSEATAAPSGTLHKTFVTAVGGRQEITLVDHSKITLNTGTRMTVAFTPHSRDVSLYYGEASFDVTPDPARPFNVHAGKRDFQVLGTRFNVRVLTPENVEVTVTEGQVKVLYAPPRWPETPAKRRENLSYGEATLTAFETALVEPGYQSVRPLMGSELETRLAWQRGMLVFDGAALEDVLAEVERYTTTKFVLADKVLANVRIAGSFRTGDVNGFLHELREKYHVDSRGNPQGRVVLSALQTL
ncbi:MAG TPA: FecR domain-containing protein [Steroidobacteraceae bacterium]|nr:FecR domain-containing protein [Steroidobacteraceae bacterium]